MNNKCLTNTFPKVNNISTITILVILAIFIGLGQRGSIEFLQKNQKNKESSKNE